MLANAPIILFIDALDSNGKCHKFGNAPFTVLAFKYMKYEQELILVLYRLDSIPEGIVNGPDIRNILPTSANCDNDSRFPSNPALLIHVQLLNSEFKLDTEEGINDKLNLVLPHTLE